jgi:hypothetical protein
MLKTKKCEINCLTDEFVHAPESIASDTSITPLERLLLQIIYTFSYRDGFCFATNSFLGEKIGVADALNIRKMIMSLKNKGAIRIEMEGSIRKIFSVKYMVKCINDSGQALPLEYDNPE